MRRPAPGRRARATRRRIGVIATAALVEVCLQLRLPLPRVAAALGSPLRTGPVADLQDEPPRLLRWALQELYDVDRVLRRWPFGDTCLRRCLVAGRRLRGVSPELVLGVMRKDGVILAHSWLEVGGHPLDPSAAEYAQLSGQ